MDLTDTDSEEDGGVQEENLSFADRLKLKKSRPGSRNIKGEGPSSHTTSRANKNRPREVSSKVPVRFLGPNSKKQAASSSRDPRFDSLCGDFDEKKFSTSYSFIKDIKMQERRKLASVYKKEKKRGGDNIEKLEGIKCMIQRIDNQEREWKKRDAEKEQSKMEKHKQIEMMLEGKKPYFMKKSEKKFQNLMGTYDALKNSGKLEKRMKKKNKKNSKKPYVTD
ncbi:hypothetical protein AAG570_003616 [Ranatra chinensis]|uniref:rRNA biogenesis protein RRP36 n=1 Tax=Ranatra chinensis TaxID=642074 RepID=A0ABD0Y4T7_9HEMI